MKKTILISACILLVIAAAGAIYFWPYLYALLRTPRLAEDMEAVVRDYRTLDTEFSFDPEKDTMLTTGQVARFNACRDRLMGFLTDWQKDMEGKMPLNLETMRNAFRAVDLCRLHQEGLRAEEMSPAEYKWILERILRILKSGESGNAPETISSLREDFDATRVQLELHPSGTRFTWIYIVPGQPMKELWKKIEVEEGIPGEPELDAVAGQAEKIRNTMPLIGQFDLGFLKYDYLSESER